jgi:hypothetical protein
MLAWIRDNSDSFSDIHLTPHIYTNTQSNNQDNITETNNTTNVINDSSSSTNLIYVEEEDTTNTLITTNDVLNHINTKLLWVSDLISGISHIEDLPLPPTDTKLSIPLPMQPSVLSVNEIRDIYDVILIPTYESDVVESNGDNQNETNDNSETKLEIAPSKEKRSTDDVAPMALHDDGDNSKENDNAYVTAEDALKELLQYQSCIKSHWIELQQSFSQVSELTGCDMMPLSRDSSNNDVSLLPLENTELINAAMNLPNDTRMAHDRENGMSLVDTNTTNNTNTSTTTNNTKVDQSNRDVLNSNTPLPSSSALPFITSTERITSTLNIFNNFLSNNILLSSTANTSSYNTSSNNNMIHQNASSECDDVRSNTVINSNNSDILLDVNTTNSHNNSNGNNISPMKPQNLSRSIMNEWGLLDAVNSRDDEDDISHSTSKPGLHSESMAKYENILSSPSISNPNSSMSYFMNVSYDAFNQLELEVDTTTATTTTSTTTSNTITTISNAEIAISSTDRNDELHSPDLLSFTNMSSNIPSHNIGTPEYSTSDALNLLNNTSEITAYAMNFNITQPSFS